jgi:preprotein translocase subunit SecD
MKKRVLFLSALATVFMNLGAEELQEFSQGKKKFSKNSTLEIFPSKLSKTKDKKSWTYGKEQIIPLTNKPVLSLADFEYRKVAGDEPGIEVFLNERNAKQLEKISKKYLKERLALVFNGEVIFAPTVKSILDDGKFKLTFRDEKSYKKVLESLN